MNIDLKNQTADGSISQDIKNIFQHHKENLAAIITLSHKIKAGIQAIDPFIQRNTSVVCPHCRNVCCTNRHGYYNLDDLIYITALGLTPLKYEYGDDSEPCRFLASHGCGLERFMRPSGCNWYFCNSLYDSMEKTGAEYDDFDASLQKVVDMWLEITSEFRKKFKELTGTEMQAIELIRISG